MANPKILDDIGSKVSELLASSPAKDIEKKSKTGLGLVIKAQIHAGGRGRGNFKESGLQGGVHLLKNSAEVSYCCS